MTARIHLTHTFASDPETVFAALSEHENLGPLFGARITRLRDGETSRNGVGSARLLRVGPLPGFVETVTAAEPHRLIEYRITAGGPLRRHRGVQRLEPVEGGGTRLEYLIEFDAVLPGLAPIVAVVLRRSIRTHLPALAP